MDQRFSQTETEVGITEFVSENTPINGIIKHRWSDFHVREISKNGEIARLTDLVSVPEKPKAKPLAVPVDENYKLSDEDEIQIIRVKSNEVKEIELKCGPDKAVRQMIHRAIKKQYPMLSSTTRNGLIVVSRKGGRKDNRDENSVKVNYRFVLWKENTDTADALFHLARAAKCKDKAFFQAGTKDKRGVTAQFITTYIDADRVLKANNKLKNIRVGNMKIHEGDHLKLGTLDGNQFEILLRDCSLVSENESKKRKVDLKSIVEKTVSKMEKTGFVNYYGLQRFGSTSIPTHSIGIEILKANYKEAVDLILKPRGEAKRRDFLSEMRKIWSETKNASKALDALQKKHINEGKVLQALVKNPTDYLGAISQIPRNTRQMYVHAVQSLIFNKLASERLKNGGSKLLIGDLVQPDENDNKTVVIVSEENQHQFTLWDIVMTLPGYDVEYSELIASKLDDILEELGLTKESFDGSVKDYRLSGAYRKLFVKPNGITGRVVEYSDNEENLIESEKDTLEGMPKTNEDEKKSDGTKMNGIIVKFTLPTSAYATMALREFMHKNETE